jgi:hypothetical protein
VIDHTNALYGIVDDLLKAVGHTDDARHEGVLFVDQAGLMTGEPRYFNDVCHLTVVCSLKFVENILAVLLPNMPGG